jgi:hypothetical protein
VGDLPVRKHPPLEPSRDIGGVPIIFGQLPTDLSLEGIDHEEWLKDKKRLHPLAEYRPHPATLPGPQEPIEEALDRCCLAICYSSTVASQAVIRNIPTSIDSEVSWAFPVARGLETREDWIKRMAYRHCYMQTGDYPVKYILESCHDALDNC